VGIKELMDDEMPEWMNESMNKGITTELKKGF